MKRAWVALLIAVAVLLLPACGLSEGKSAWRAATTAELEAFLPARAPVEKERIETELRTATGITNGQGKTVAAVVLITAGYSAEGKYSHYFLTQTGFRMGADVQLAPGAYVLGWKRTDDGLLVHVFDAATGADRGAVIARPLKQARVEPFRIWAPEERSIIQIGRFFIPYSIPGN